MFGKVNMNAWKAETTSHQYAEWSNRALRVIDKTTRPTRETFDSNHCFTFHVDKPDSKRRSTWFINIELLPDGTFAFANSYSKTYPQWYVEEVSKRICQLYKAFAEEGFLI